MDELNSGPEFGLGDGFAAGIGWQVKRSNASTDRRVKAISESKRLALYSINRTSRCMRRIRLTVVMDKLKPEGEKVRRNNYDRYIEGKN